MNDPVDLVRQIAPPVEARPDLLERVRSDLMTTITKGVEEETERPLRRRRRWAIPIAAVAVSATAAAGWAVMQDSSSSTTTIRCPENTIIDAVTGNPVADCSDTWTGIHGSEPVPSMVAYDDGRGGVHVLLGSEAVPDGYVALPGGSYQDTTLIELKDALNDVGTGLSARCVDEKTARDITRRELDRLGLTDWTIQVDSASRDGSTTCVEFLDLKRNQQQVQLMAGRDTSREAHPHAAFAAALHDRLKSECVGLDRAADLTRSLGAATNIVVNGNHIVITEEAGLVIHTIEDSSSGCTRANVTVGGSVKVTLRGPTT